MAVKQTAGRKELGEFAPKFAELNDDVLFLSLIHILPPCTSSTDWEEIPLPPQLFPQAVLFVCLLYTSRCV